MITEADIEKLIYRCFENYWNTRDSKINNLRHVPKIAANDVWQVVKQDLPNKHPLNVGTTLDDSVLGDVHKYGVGTVKHEPVFIDPTQNPIVKKIEEHAKSPVGDMYNPSKSI